MENIEWKYTKENPLRVFTAFSGFDSQCLAIKYLGIPFELIGWSEIEPNAIKAHDALFPEYADRNYGDISKIDWSQVPDFDFLTYSSPCFVAGTKVKTVDGFKQIEKISVGDKVFTHKSRYMSVVDVMSHKYSGIMVEISTCGEKILCTPHHRFLASKGGGVPKWVEAIDLLPEGYLNIYYVQEGGAILKSIDSISSATMEVVVYNMEVEEDNSYTANGVVVHNCQDFSNAGLQAGGEEGSGTRSSLLWEVKRCILAKHPKYLLMENVKALVSEKFRPTFLKWCNWLTSEGYTSFSKVMNSKDYSCPQNRERIFVVSTLESSWYNFPQPVELKLKLKDMLEERVDEKYYLDDKKVAEFIGNLDKEKIKKIVE